MATFATISGDLGTNALARAISAYSYQEYTDAVRIAGTALVGSDARISGSDEDYFGTIRWTRTLGDVSYGTTNVAGRTQINIGTETTDEGLLTDVSHDSSQYVKTLRTMGAEQFNVTQVLTQAPNAIEQVGRDFGISRARDNDAALIAVLRGITAAETGRRIDDGTALAAIGASNRYGQGIDADSALNKDAGFYFDANGPRASAVSQNDNAAARTNKLISDTTVGGRGASVLWEAASAGFSDLEPSFFYLVISPEVYHDIRSANLLDEQDRVSDGNIQLDTLMGGKFRLIVTRTVGGSSGVNDFDFSSATAAANDPVNAGSSKTSYLMLPGAIYQSDVAVPNPVAFDADESIGRGAGQRELWYRWGNIYHARGYSWTGATNAFATNTNYSTAASWQRKEAPGNLGILPIFHS